jgi:uncharacterized protein (TIGR03083 family)
VADLLVHPYPPWVDDIQHTHHRYVDGCAIEIAALSTLARSLDHSTPLEHLGGWTVGEVVAHLAGDFRWARSIIEPRRWDGQLLLSVDETGEALCDVLDHEAARMLVALRAAADEPATRCVNFAQGESGTLAFWTRHQLFETVIHRWDLEVPSGVHAPIDPDLAVDAIDEALSTYAARYAGHVIERPVTLRADGVSSSGAWRLSPFGSRGRVRVDRVEPDAAQVSGGAVDLLLAVWGRRPAEVDSLTVDEPASRRVFDGPLTA